MHHGRCLDILLTVIILVLFDNLLYVINQIKLYFRELNLELLNNRRLNLIHFLQQLVPLVFSNLFNLFHYLREFHLNRRGKRLDEVNLLKLNLCQLVRLYFQGLLDELLLTNQVGGAH